MFVDDLQFLALPPVNESETQRMDRLIQKKEVFFQSSLVILFNSAEVYLKAKIAEKSVYLLLKDIKDAKKDISFFECQTIEAAELPGIYEGISNMKLSNGFKASYDSLRKERNKVIHLGRSNSINTRKDLIVAFLFLVEEIVKEPLVDIVLVLVRDQRTMSSEEIVEAKKSFCGAVISILKDFFPLGEILKETYSLPKLPKSWTVCATCQNIEPTLAIISNTKSICLSCGLKNGV